jgi:enoyl-CoA hydratase/carnithine racemase
MIKENGTATLLLNRGKVNALNEPLIEQLHSDLKKLEKDKTTRVILLKGEGKFFSFGFDVPELLSYTHDEFVGFIRKFTGLYRYLFIYPKPTIAVINGHAIAGGCMLTTACDFRLMVSGKARISLNEISFGASVTAGAVEMLEYCVGQREAQSILFSGAMYSAEEAYELGLIDRIAEDGELVELSQTIAQYFIDTDSVAFASIKGLIKGPTAERMQDREPDSIQEFVDIWYSKSTWKNLQEILIHE